MIMKVKQKMSTITETIAHTLSYVNTGWNTAITVYLAKWVSPMRTELDELTEVVIEMNSNIGEAEKISSMISELDRDVSNIKIDIDEINQNFQLFQGALGDEAKYIKKLERDLKKMKEQMSNIIKTLEDDNIELNNDNIKKKTKKKKSGGKERTIDDDLNLFG